ncbi:transferrin-binding protein-like solute binding protein [Cereibacter sediminicola]|uniref:transferrin-binding protein-like solute binding protein n=1 Tax=Cereibacter sediminicola TaxID=2584941 RepID=UPI0011A9DBA8|nr:transferrin-binding protein-like solute binding protein [Cereibacter sediminicola]
MNIKNVVGLVVVAAGLSACGGSDGGTSFDSLATRGDSLIEKYEVVELTPVGSMPTAGTASYEGVAGYFFSEAAYDAAESAADADVLSTVSLTANFSDSSIAGSLGNFKDREGVSVSGSVAIKDGQIMDNVFMADLDGSITAENETATVRGVTYGGFVGGTAEAVMGAIEADIIHGPSDVEGLYGEFIAERK